MVKLGYLFDLLNMTRRIKFPKSIVEDYINLDLLALHMMEIMLATRNHFKDLTKMVAKLVGVTPLTF